MKIFITGATGYIGERLTARLLEQGHEVHALCRRTPEVDMLRHPGFFFHPGGLDDAKVIAEAMKGCEAVFHLAAIARVWVKNPREYYNVNVNGTLRVLDAAMKNHVSKVVFTSSAAVYGASNGNPLTEQGARTTPFFTDYEASKFIAEEKIQHYVRWGLPVVIVHPTKVYGPGLLTESNALSQLIRQYLSGEWHLIPGNGKMTGNFVYIDDVVNGHIQALTNGRQGEKYILGGVNASFNEFFETLKRISGKEHFMVHVPYPLMMLYGLQEELLAKVSSHEPKITRKWIKKYSHNLALSSEKAQRELGYTITPLADGLRRTIHWLEENFQAIA